ncbi:MAG TPA: hypothetical protein PK048_00445 [Candidatus Absconditabacterales bacterium]|nr:hypothetical protein [Candidatus Absconditabacterales bacterium]
MLSVTIANRCLALVVWEILVIGVFHLWEGTLFDRSEMIIISLHLLLSLFGLCFYVVMRSKWGLARIRGFSFTKIIKDICLYLVFDYIIIHVLISFIAGDHIHIEWIELIVILIGVILINSYFDTHHHCCHEHCQ